MVRWWRLALLVLAGVAWAAAATVLAVADHCRGARMVGLDIRAEGVRI
jgi:hypothetical protein